MKYHAPAPSPVQKKKHVRDSWPITILDGTYKPHTESGRWKALQLIKAGMTFGAWTTEAAKKGFETDFCLKALTKHAEKDTPAFAFADKHEGKTFKEYKASLKPAPKPKAAPKKKAA
jgi:hypothetical protein